MGSNLLETTKGKPPHSMASLVQVATLFIVMITFAAIAIGRVPSLAMNRATIALVGAATLIAIGALSEDEAFAAIDTGTILLLAAMMVINVNLRLAGFFGVVGQRVLTSVHRPQTLLAIVVLISGTLSAIFLNDTICLMFTPLVVDITKRLGRNPIPYLIGLATATNIGSTATITGNPQNVIIGQASDISYLTFLVHLGPVALLGLVVCWGIIIIVFRSEFKGQLARLELPESHIYRPLLRRTILVVMGLMVAFLMGLPIVSSACVAAGLLLVSRLRPAKLLDIDWNLLAFFGGLFVVTSAIEITGMSDQLFQGLRPALKGSVASLSIATAALSNVVSNVPAVLLLRPEMQTQQEWLVLAMASTLAGNFTLLGSAANLIVAELAAEQGVKLSFLDYLKVGVPVTLLTLCIGIIWLDIIL